MRNLPLHAEPITVREVRDGELLDKPTERCRLVTILHATSRGGCSAAQPPKAENALASCTSRAPSTVGGAVRHQDKQSAHNLAVTAVTFSPRPPASLVRATSLTSSPTRNLLPSCSPPFLSVALKRLSTHIKRASSIRCQKRTALPRRSPLARFLWPPGSMLREGASAPSLLSSSQTDFCPSVLSSSLRPAPPGTAERAQDCPALALAAQELLSPPTQTFSLASAF